MSQESEEQILARQLYAEETEQAVLACMLLYPSEVLEEIVHQEIMEKDFFVPRHKLVFRALIQLHEEGMGIDGTILNRWFVDNKYDKEMDVISFIGTLYGVAALSQNLGSYLFTLAQKRLLREMDNALRLAKQDMLDMPDSATSVLERTESAFTQIWDRVQTKAESDFSVEIQEAGLSMIEHAGKGGGMKGLPTGFKKLDELTKGWESGQLIVLAALTGLGKSAIALSFLRRIVGGQFNAETGNHDLPGRPAKMFSMEMKRPELFPRFYAMETGISLDDLSMGNLGETAQNKVTRAQERMASWPLFIDDTSGMDIDLMRTRLRRAVKKHGVVLAVVDYLQRARSRKYANNKYAEVSYISWALKEMALENGIPIIALAQFNRAAAGKDDEEPNISQLRDSGSIEQDADKVLLLHRHKPGATKRVAKAGLSHYTLIAAKQRNGRQGKVDLDFYGYRMSFEDADEWGTG